MRWRGPRACPRAEPCPPLMGSADRRRLGRPARAWPGAAPRPGGGGAPELCVIALPEQLTAGMGSAPEGAAPASRALAPTSPSPVVTLQLRSASPAALRQH